MAIKYGVVLQRVVQYDGTNSSEILEVAGDALLTGFTASLVSEADDVLTIELSVRDVDGYVSYVRVYHVGDWCIGPSAPVTDGDFRQKWYFQPAES